MSDHPVSATLSTEQLPTAGLWSLEDHYASSVNEMNCSNRFSFCARSVLNYSFLVVLFTYHLHQ